MKKPKAVDLQEVTVTVSRYGEDAPWALGCIIASGEGAGRYHVWLDRQSQRPDGWAKGEDAVLYKNPLKRADGSYPGRFDSDYFPTRQLSIRAEFGRELLALMLTVAQDEDLFTKALQRNQQEDAKEQWAAHKARHVRDGGPVCLFCSSSDISGDSMVVENGIASQEVSCMECGAVVREEYDMARVAVVAMPEKPGHQLETGMLQVAEEEAEVARVRAEAEAARQLWRETGKLGHVDHPRLKKLPGERGWQLANRTHQLWESLYDPCMLRIEEGQVRTSRGAAVPVDHAIRGLRLVRAVMARGKEYQRNGHTEHLGHYAIDRIEVDGTLKAGCHVIPWAEIEKVAGQLDRIEEARAGVVPESDFRE